MDELDPRIGNVAALFTGSHNRSTDGLKKLALFTVLIMPWLLAFGTGMLLSQLGRDVNWLKLVFYLSVAIGLSLTFSIDFCIAFLLPFSIALAVWSSNSFTVTWGILFSLMLGLAYGLNMDSARWGLTAGLVYGVVIGILLDPWRGLIIGGMFLIGYFRILFYMIEAPLSWGLGNWAARAHALQLWEFQPVGWDELIWFPLPHLDRHLLALKRQDEPAFHDASLQVQESFRQGWAAEGIMKLETRLD